MKRQTGFSLVELMIAVVLGMLLAGAAITALSSMRKVNTTTTGTASLADSGRFAFENLGAALRAAGYLGCSTSPLARVDLNAGLPVPITDVGEPIGGYEYTGTGTTGAWLLAPPYVKAASAGSWTGSAGVAGSLAPIIYAAQVGAGPIGSPIAGSDVILAHRSLDSVPALYLTAPSSVGDTLLTTTLATVAQNGFTSVLAGGGVPVAAVSNCQSAEVFSVSAAGGNTLTFSPANVTAGLVTAYGAGAHVTAVTTSVYYIGVGSDGEPSLFVLDSGGGTAFGAPVELVSDVENMQVLYGVDTTGAGTVTRYVTADQVAAQGNTGDFGSVIAVKVALLLAAQPASAAQPAAAPTYTLLGTTVTAPLDTRMRSVVMATFTLRNGAG